MSDFKKLTYDGVYGSHRHQCIICQGNDENLHMNYYARPNARTFTQWQNDPKRKPSWYGKHLMVCDFCMAKNDTIDKMDTIISILSEL